MAEESVPPIIHALSGAVASIFSNTAVYPLDFVTTRLQTQEQGPAAALEKGQPQKQYTGLQDAFEQIYQKHGLAEFYRGLGADNLSTMASTFCYHFAYNFIRDRRVAVHTKRRGGHKPSVLSMMEELTIGASAGVISRFVTSPASNIVTRSQTQDGGTAMDIVRDIYNEKGITGFFSGMKASVILAANPSIAYYLFEVQKALLLPKSRRASPKAVEIFLMSATGKAIATLLLYPVILIKARTQAQRVKVGIFAMIRRIFTKEGGLAGFYKGAPTQVLKGFLSQGILMLLKDKIAALIVAGYLAVSRRK
ncbi:mitochondrial carrier domain-containing protein, partial [Protomyces lactucae-debilis]